METSARFVAATVLALIAAAATAHDAAPGRAVTVSGEGEAAGRPDRARLVLGVDKIDPDLKKAEAEVNRIVRAYVTDAKALGAKDEAIATTGVSVQAEYTWDERARERRFSGYRVARQIDVRVDHLDRLGDFILKATLAGVNQVQGPMLESSRQKELEQQALAKAASHARDKARLLAESLGVRLGVAQRIHESGAVPPPMPYQLKAMRAEAAADGNAEMGIALGEIRYRATVSVEFELLPP